MQNNAEKPLKNQSTSLKINTLDNRKAVIEIINNFFLFEEISILLAKCK